MQIMQEQQIFSNWNGGLSVSDLAPAPDQDRAKFLKMPLADLPLPLPGASLPPLPPLDSIDFSALPFDAAEFMKLMHTFPPVLPLKKAKGVKHKATDSLDDASPPKKSKKQKELENMQIQREYKCKWCPRSYDQPSALATHERVHTGEQPFPCRYCPKCFSQKANAKRHMKICKQKPPQTETQHAELMMPMSKMKEFALSPQLMMPPYLPSLSPQAYIQKQDAMPSVYAMQG